MKWDNIFVLEIHTFLYVTPSYTFLRWMPTINIFPRSNHKMSREAFRISLVSPIKKYTPTNQPNISHVGSIQYGHVSISSGENPAKESMRRVHMNLIWSFVIFSAAWIAFTTAIVSFTDLVLTQTRPFSPTTLSKGTSFPRDFISTHWGFSILRNRKWCRNTAAEFKNKVPWWIKHR